MKIIKHVLLTKQKPRKYNLNVEVDLYSYAAELYAELDKIGIINRIKSVPHLGFIKVPKELFKTRYDYIMLQLYLHKLIKNNLQGQLRFTYNNKVNSTDFFEYNTEKEKPTIGDILQILSLVYNIGHFYNTFIASRALVMMASQDTNFANLLSSASTNCRFKHSVHKYIEEKNYHRIHLINSLLVLEKCDQTKQSVLLAIQILYAYIDEKILQINDKLYYVFSIFKKVRNVSYLAYDLQIANTPFTIDLCNEAAMLLIFKELLSEYNNTSSSNTLIESISKLVSDTVYNENSNAISYYKISKKMVSFLKRECYFNKKNYYQDYFFRDTSVLNEKYNLKRDYTQTQILKLTFKYIDRQISENLLNDIEKINNTRVGYYNRYSDEQTILVSIKKDCNRKSKTISALKVLKCVISNLRKIKSLCTSDNMYLLSTKFFLFYLFDENPLTIKETIDEKKCVLCTRGKKNRVSEISNILKQQIGSEDERHEIKFMIKLLKTDIMNDTSISIPASIIVYQKDKIYQKLCEFDGMIIHPMRKKDQVIFLEAKNTSSKPCYGKKCIEQKLDKLGLQYSTDDIDLIDKCNAMLKYTV